MPPVGGTAPPVSAWPSCFIFLGGEPFSELWVGAPRLAWCPFLVHGGAAVLAHCGLAARSGGACPTCGWCCFSRLLLLCGKVLL